MPSCPWPTAWPVAYGLRPAAYGLGLDLCLAYAYAHMLCGPQTKWFMAHGMWGSPQSPQTRLGSGCS